MSWKIVLSVALVVLSAAVYFIHYLIFRDAHHIFIYLIGDIAFVFLEVLLVTMVIHEVLAVREKKAMRHKLNMIIGAFFSEVGRELIEVLSVFQVDRASLAKELKIRQDCSEEIFRRIKSKVCKRQYDIDAQRGDLERLKELLKSKRGFLLNLLENPNLLEHEMFTNLLWAVFHLTEELCFRESLSGLPESDYSHLAGDMKRAYQRLILEWVEYMRHLKHHYGYLFSLAVRTNPFDEDACVEVK